jgi:hypothetical protein
VVDAGSKLKELNEVKIKQPMPISKNGCFRMLCRRSIDVPDRPPVCLPPCDALVK